MTETTVLTVPPSSALFQDNATSIAETHYQWSEAGIICSAHSEVHFRKRTQPQPPFLFLVPLLFPNFSGLPLSVCARACTLDAKSARQPFMIDTATLPSLPENADAALDAGADVDGAILTLAQILTRSVGINIR